MPTLSWVLEGDIERFLEGTTQVDEPGPPKPPDHPCPFCYSRFPHAHALSAHLGSSHVGYRPFLTVSGIEPNPQETLRRACSADAIQLFNSTSVRLSHDGRRFDSCAEANLKKIFENAKGRVWIELENAFDAKAEPIRSLYDLEFRAPSLEDQVQVDRTFVSVLGRPDATVTLVRQFIDDCPSGAVDDYVEAMANYVLGILMKDADPATGIQGRPDYRPKLNSALRILQEHDRALPKLLASLIRFSANDFSRWWEATGIPRLDRVNALLGPITGTHGAALVREKPDSSGGTPICPIDNGSETVMRRAEHLSNLARWGDQLDEQLRAEVDHSGLERFDQLKLAALWAERAIALGRLPHASEPLGMLLGDHCFGTWAEATLEGLTNDD